MSLYIFRLESEREQEVDHVVLQRVNMGLQGEEDRLGEVGFLVEQVDELLTESVHSVCY